MDLYDIDFDDVLVMYYAFQEHRLNKGYKKIQKNKKLK